MAGCIGIDESNHGRVPEIFVAVYSAELGDIYRAKELPKKRSRKEISEVIEHAEFKHLVISQEYRNLMTDQGMILVAVSELVNAFSEKYGSIDMVFVDGEIRNRTLAEIRKNIRPVCARLLFEANADKNIPIVNSADCIASGLHRHYSRFKSTADSRKYIGELVTLDIKRYREQLDMLES